MVSPCKVERFTGGCYGFRGSWSLMPRAWSKRANLVTGVGTTPVCAVGSRVKRVVEQRSYVSGSSSKIHAAIGVTVKGGEICEHTQRVHYFLYNLRNLRNFQKPFGRTERGPEHWRDETHPRASVIPRIRHSAHPRSLKRESSTIGGRRAGLPRVRTRFGSTVCSRNYWTIIGKQTFVET